MAQLRRTRRVRTVLLVAVMVVVGVLGLAACAAGPNEAAGVGDPDVAGFWLGLWQGLISPITFIVSLFNPDVGIYEIHNNGNWYNFGFMLGVSMIFSGGAGGGVASGRRRHG
ncbi:hypothetical protein [Pengzhenrongella phosphoraccumulans]|uniref:hypothetical protein n=1 Tax=Pengzhenrongella phosphoraccumulans TaxID=3114394 RepID=UPI0038902240